MSSESTPILLRQTDQTKGYKHEFKCLLKNAIPLVISYLLQNSLQSVSIISAGHLVSFISSILFKLIYIECISRAPMNWPPPL